MNPTHIYKTSDLQQMSSNVKVYMNSVQMFQNLDFGQRSRYLNPQTLAMKMVPPFMVPSIKETGIYETQGFIDRERYWEVSALVYAPVLGDIFQYMIVMAATQLSVPISRLRLVVLLKEPEAQAVVTPDGAVDASSKKHSEKPFYCKLVNFELLGANYDFHANTICDATPESISGYRNYINLYATVAIIQESPPEYEKMLKHRTHGAQLSEGKLRVP